MDRRKDKLVSWTKDEFSPKKWVMRILSVLVFTVFALFTLPFWAKLFKSKKSE